MGAARRGARRSPRPPASCSASRPWRCARAEAAGWPVRRDLIGVETSRRARAGRRAAATPWAVGRAAASGGAAQGSARLPDAVVVSRAVPARARRRVARQAARRGPRSAARTRPRWRSADAKTTQRQRAASSELQRLGARRAAATVARGLCATRRARPAPAGRAPRRARTPAASPRASSTYSRWWPTGLRNARDRRAALRSPRRPSTTTSRRSCASSASRPAPRRPPRPTGWGSSKDRESSRCDGRPRTVAVDTVMQTTKEDSMDLYVILRRSGWSSAEELERGGGAVDQRRQRGDGRRRALDPQLRPRRGRRLRRHGMHLRGDRARRRSASTHRSPTCRPTRSFALPTRSLVRPDPQPANATA